MSYSKISANYHFIIFLLSTFITCINAPFDKTQQKLLNDNNNYYNSFKNLKEIKNGPDITKFEKIVKELFQKMNQELQY